MTNRIAGPGQGLPLPQSLYPANLTNGASFSESTNELTLVPGQQLPIPAGDWLVTFGGSILLQWLDPVTTAWRGMASPRVKVIPIRSDGFNYRLANLTQCVVTAIVTNGGSGFVQSTATITPSAGSSTWQAIVGGAVSTTIASITNAGANYTVPPICVIPAPPAPGIQATAQAYISSGTIASLAITNQGAGYPTAPTVYLLPNPTDPNLGTITQATATLQLTGSGKITAAICTNPGGTVATSMTLTTGGGAGTGATCVPVFMLTATGITVTGAGTAVSATNEITSVGGIPSATPAFTNPAHELTAYSPRKASMLAAVGSGTIASVSATYDSGLFVGTPLALVLSQSPMTAIPTVSFTLGGLADTAVLQPT